MITRLACLSILFVPTTILAQASLRQSIPGRYHLRVCHGPCTAQSLRAEGTLVLLPGGLRDAAGNVLHAQSGREPANGCFAFATLHRFGKTMLGSRQPGYLAWSLDPLTGEVRFDLVPDRVDAFYPVTLHAARDGLAGEGRSVFDDQAPAPPPDIVFADRRGKADPATCDRLQKQWDVQCTGLSGARCH
jgi:hypothetical protein